MKIKSSIRIIVFGWSVLSLCGAVHAADIPQWWHTRGLVNTNLVSNDYAPVNVGQLKNVAYQTWVEVTNQLTHINAGNIVSGTLASSLLPTNGVWNAGSLIVSNLNLNMGSTEITGQLTVNNLDSSNVAFRIRQNFFQWFFEAAGGDGDDVATSVAETSDGGIVVAGYTKSYGAGLEDVLLLKFDAAGTLLWARTAGGSDYDEARSVIATSDGGIIVAGTTGSYGAGILLLKFDAAGTLVWARITEDVNYHEAYSVAETGDGGIVVAGASSSDMLLLKFDVAGTLLWSRTAEGGYHDCHATSVVTMGDGGIVVAGYRYGDMLLFKFDVAGTLLWARTAGNYGYPHSVTATSDGGIVVAGYYGYNVLLLKVDADGAPLWSRTAGGDYDDVATSVAETSDGGLLVAGTTRSYGTGSVFGEGGYHNVLLLKFDAAGTLLWARIAEGGSGYYSYSVTVTETSDGGIVVAGRTSRCGAGGKDVLLLKVKSDGNLPGCEAVVAISPTIGSPNISFSEPWLSVTNLSVAVNAIFPTMSSPSPTVTDVFKPGGQRDVFVIDDGGWVGIGTTLPAAPLDVAGTIRAIAFSGDRLTIRSNLVVGLGAAIGSYAVSEGISTIAYGIASHAEGTNSIAEGDASHAEGSQTESRGEASHAEGYETCAGGNSSHAEGTHTYAGGNSSHAEGYLTGASGEASHAEGMWTIASGIASHAEGTNSIAEGDASHAEGNGTAARGFGSHAEGDVTTASGNASHAEGWNTTASGAISHAEGYYTMASGSYSHAEGLWTKASGLASHAAGSEAKATNDNTYVWSDGTPIGSTATKQYTVYAKNGIRLLGGGLVFADNDLTIASNLVVGTGTAAGLYAVAEGNATVANGAASHAAGQNARATNNNTYVWSDGTTVGSTTTQQYTVYAKNGIRLLGGVISGNGSGLTNLVELDPAWHSGTGAVYSAIGNLKSEIGNVSNALTAVDVQVESRMSKVESRTNNWNTAYNWGSHATNGYITTNASDARYVNVIGDAITGSLTIASNLIVAGVLSGNGSGLTNLVELDPAWHSGTGAVYSAIALKQDASIAATDTELLSASNALAAASSASVAAVAVSCLSAMAE